MPETLNGAYPLPVLEAWAVTLAELLSEDAE
jgi:hypothetical protein